MGLWPTFPGYFWDVCALRFKCRIAIGLTCRVWCDGVTDAKILGCEKIKPPHLIRRCMLSHTGFNSKTLALVFYLQMKLLPSCIKRHIGHNAFSIWLLVVFYVCWCETGPLFFQYNPMLQSNCPFPCYVAPFNLICPLTLFVYNRHDSMLFSRFICLYEGYKMYNV